MNDTVKAILVIKMQSSCDTCDFVDERYCYCNVPWDENSINLNESGGGE